MSSGDVRVPGYRDPLNVTSEDVRMVVAHVLSTYGCIDTPLALHLAGIAAFRLRLERTELAPALRVVA